MHEIGKEMEEYAFEAFCIIYDRVGYPGLLFGLILGRSKGHLWCEEARDEEKVPSRIKILMGIVAGRAIHRPENAPSDVFTSAQSSGFGYTRASGRPLLGDRCSRPPQFIQLPGTDAACAGQSVPLVRQSS